ncbi:MAG: hypothetical protein ACLR8Y_08890 [Alistipes indistinctus]
MFPTENTYSTLLSEGRCQPARRDQRAPGAAGADPQPHMDKQAVNKYLHPHVRHDQAKTGPLSSLHPLDVHRLDGARRMQLGRRYPRRSSKSGAGTTSSPTCR